MAAQLKASTRFAFLVCLQPFSRYTYTMYPGGTRCIVGKTRSAYISLCRFALSLYTRASLFCMIPSLIDLIGPGCRVTDEAEYGEVQFFGFREEVSVLECFVHKYAANKKTGLQKHKKRTETLGIEMFPTDWVQFADFWVRASAHFA